MSVLSDLLQACDDRQLTPVPTPEWPELDGKLFVRKLSAQQRMDFWDAVRKHKATEGPAFVGMIVAGGVVDPEGQLVFSYDQHQWLAGRDADAIGRLSEEIDRLNLLSNIEREKLVKNSEATGDSAST